MLRQNDFWTVSFLIGAVLWFGGGMLFDDKLPIFRDLVPYFYPMRFSLAQSFHAGALPLWEQHQAMGFPLLADFQSGSFYPPHLLLAVLPFVVALRMLFILHYLVAALGTYRLCRYWNYSPVVALTGSLMFTLGGTTISLMNLLNHFQTAVWLPWVILFGEKYLTGPSWRSFLAFVAIVLVQFLAGSPEMYAMSSTLLFLDTMRLKTANPTVTWKKNVLLLAAATLTVACLAMAQLLPTIELIGESRTRRVMSLVEATAWSFRPLELINLFFPDKHVDFALARPLRPFFSETVPWLASHYLGALAGVAILCWAWYAPKREKIVLVFLVVLSLILAFGNYTGVYPAILRHVPFLSLFRFPEKFFFFTFALLVFISIKGVHELIDTKSEGKAPVWFSGSIVLLLTALYILFRLDSLPVTRFISWARGSAITFSSLEFASLMLTRFEIQIALSFGIFVLVAGKVFGFIRKSLFGALIATVVLIDLGSVHRPIQLLAKVELHNRSLILPEPPAEPARLFYKPAGGSLHPSQFFFSTPPKSFEDFSAMVFRDLLPDTGIFYGFDYMQEIDALGRWPYTTFLLVANELPQDALYRLLGALNVKYVVSFFPLDSRGIVFERQFPELSSWLYRIDSVTPRAYTVNRASVELNRFSVVKRLASADFKPLEEVILEHPVELAPAAGFRGIAKIERYENQTVQLRASLNAAGILVLADSFYPGWHVYVDGKEEEVLRANLFFRGVKLTAGEHRVEFRYLPQSFRIGAMISLASILGLIVVSVVLTVKARSQRNISVFKPIE
jgi:membrane protein YfhO